MAQLPNEIYVHVEFDAEKFKLDLKAAIKDAITEVMGKTDRYLKVVPEATDPK